MHFEKVIFENISETEIGCLSADKKFKTIAQKKQKKTSPAPRAVAAPRLQRPSCLLNN